MPEKVKIEIGQKWKDKDRRREQEGTVRTFSITGVNDHTVWCCEVGKGNGLREFQRRRFGSNATNDSFVLVASNA